MTNIFGARMGQSHVNKLAPAQNRRPAAKCKKKPQKPGLGWVQRKDAQSHLMQFLYTMARTIRPWDAVDSLYMFILRVDSLYMKVYNMFTYVFLYFPHLRNGDFKISMACLVLVGYQRRKLTRCNFSCRWQLGREAHREAIATREVEVTARVRRVRPQRGKF